jgi:ABC-type transport system substrate-binding protein
VFQIESREPGRRVVLVPAKGLPPERAPRVPEVILEICPGGDSRALRVALGGSDLALDVPVRELDAILGDLDPELRTGGVNTVEMLIWNPFQVGHALRRGAGMAIDRTRLLELVRYRDRVYGRPGRGFLPDLYNEIEPYPFDPAPVSAGRGHRDSIPGGVGGTDGPIEILYEGADAFRAALMVRLESDLASAGIAVEAVPLPREEVEARLAAGMFECVLAGFRPPRHYDTSALWASWGRWNGAAYVSARVDSLYLVLHAASADSEARAIALAIERQVRADDAVTFVLERERVDLIGPRVEGWTGTVHDPLGRLEEVRLVAPAGAPSPDG